MLIINFMSVYLKYSDVVCTAIIPALVLVVNMTRL